MTSPLESYSFCSRTLLSGSKMEVYAKVTQNELVEEALNDICLIKKIESMESLFDYVTYNEVAKTALKKTKCNSEKRPKIPYNKVHIRPVVLQSNSGFIINLRKRLAFLNQARHKELK